MIPPFPVGQKVVCIDDRFSGAVFEDFDHTPKAGQVYTISDIYWDEEYGTGRMVLGVDLVEVPSILPNWSGFRLSRFRLLEDEKVLRARRQKRTGRIPRATTLPAA